MKKLLSAIAFLAIAANLLAQVTLSNYGNGLPATDALGRKLPVKSETGKQRNKLVGIFYWTWHTDDNATFSPVLNITEILKQYPLAATDASHPAWLGLTGGVFWWDTP